MPPKRLRDLFGLPPRFRTNALVKGTEPAMLCFPYFLLILVAACGEAVRLGRATVWEIT